MPRPTGHHRACKRGTRSLERPTQQAKRLLRSMSSPVDYAPALLSEGQRVHSEELLRRRQRALGVNMPLFYSDPVHIVRGEGVWLFDPDGGRYLDMYNNVPCVGHAHPRVVAAMSAQAATLNVHSRYLHEGIVEYAERLAALHTESFSTVVFTCTGTEANEVAIAMARAVTGGEGIIGTDAAYHGNSAEVGKLTRLSTASAAMAPEVRAIPFPQTLRPLRGNATPTELTERYLEALQDAIDDLVANDIKPAALLVCPILANEGLPDIPPQFMARAKTLMQAAGGLVIADEVQSGFGRTGRWWGYETAGFVPDIVSMGKPMGGGLPLAGTIASEAIVNNFRSRVRYFNTFAASPLQAAVGMAVLDVIEDEKLLAQVTDVGAFLRDELEQLSTRCEQIADVRGHGLFVGIEWVDNDTSRMPDSDGAVAIVDALRAKGILISNAGAERNVLKIRPPLVFNQEHAEIFMIAFEDVLKECGCLG